MDYIPTEMVVEMGLAIGKKELRSKGIGAEVVRTVLKHSFENLNVQSVYAYVLPSNEKSLACFRKCGFTISGRRRSWGYFNGPMDWYYLDSIREEYDTMYVKQSTDVSGE